MKLTVINTGTFKLDGGAMFGVVPKKLWKTLNPPDENNLCTWTMRCLLVEWDNRKMLIDCGMGDKQDAKFFSHYEPSYQPTLLADLAAKGHSAESITDVFLTHLHFDHCGGAISLDAEKKLVTTFPNATYWSNQAHWDWAINPNAREKASFLKENILPIQESGQLKMIPVQQNIEAFPNIEVFFAYGHTEAMMIPKISYKGHQVCYMADLLPSVAHLPMAYVMAYDMRPLITLEEKNIFLQQAVANNSVLFFEHDPINECCALINTEKGIRAEQTFNLSDWPLGN